MRLQRHDGRAKEVGSCSNAHGGVDGEEIKTEEYGTSAEWTPREDMDTAISWKRTLVVFNRMMCTWRAKSGQWEVSCER